jgi:hypothetical protein
MPLPGFNEMQFNVSEFANLLARVDAGEDVGDIQQGGGAAPANIQMGGVTPASVAPAVASCSYDGALGQDIPTKQNSKNARPTRAAALAAKKEIELSNTLGNNPHNKKAVAATTITATTTSATETEPVVGAQPSVKKRKRNRLAQKRYRDRKKSEANELLSQLEGVREEYNRLQQERQQVIQVHTKNAVLKLKNQRREQEIAEMRLELAELQSGSPLSRQEHDASLMKNKILMHAFKDKHTDVNDKVQQICKDKFVDDVYEHIADECRVGMKNDRERMLKLPLLLSFLRERIVR